MSTGSPWLTIDEAKEYARLGKNQIYTACRTRRLKARQTVAPQGKWLIHRDDLDAWLRGEIVEKPTRRTSKLKSVS